jgi:hypothetical protein
VRCAREPGEAAERHAQAACRAEQARVPGGEKALCFPVFGNSAALPGVHAATRCVANLLHQVGGACPRAGVAAGSQPSAQRTCSAKPCRAWSFLRSSAGLATRMWLHACGGLCSSHTLLCAASRVRGYCGCACGGSSCVCVPARRCARADCLCPFCAASGTTSHPPAWRIAVGSCCLHLLRAGADTVGQARAL